MADIDVSVIIPTRGRVRILMRTVEIVAGQELGGLRVEVVVADNGSRDDTLARLRAARSRLPLPVNVVEAPAGAQGAARNHAIAAARGQLILFLGDDTPPAGPGLVKGHADAHARKPGLWRGVMGPCVWSPNLELTPIMEWLARTGKSNDYTGLEESGAARTQFYAANSSIRRDALLAVDGFDERFSAYGFEDYDLALRLRDRGFRLEFRPDLVAFHEHRYTLSDSLRRMEAMGRTAKLVNTIHAGRAGLRTPAPGGAKAAIARAGGRIAPRVPVPGWTPRALRDAAFRALHFSMLARGYSSTGLPTDEKLRGGISKHGVPA